MNKQGWEVKKLGNIATYINGYAFKPIDWEAQGLPIIRIQNLNSSTACYNYTTKQLDKKYIVNNGDILISWSASLGVYEWLGKKAILNQHIFKVVFDKIKINKIFFKYQIDKKIIEMLQHIHGATMKHITKKNFDNIAFLLPPISIQNQIVKDLDTLQAIITKKKAQLVELDNLAQATFYEMFGDPVENEKGWNIKYWKDIFITCTGKLNANAMKDNGQYPFFTCSKQIFYIDVFAFDCEALILAGNNATANYDVKYYNGKFNAYQRTYILNLINKNFSYIYFKFLLESKLDLMQSQSLGISTKYLTMTILNSLNFITPPCTIQNQFAKRIESIEKQKLLINQSISETQLLFDSAMDNYFN